jgi:enamine deaminase RidA (YjgF/YER057c/UK114 family)
MRIEERLSKLNIRLKRTEGISKEIASYVKSGNLVFTSGMIPRNADGTMPQGKVGREFTTVQAQSFVYDVGIELLSILNTAAGGLENVRRVVYLQCYVNSVPEYTEQSVLFNTVSELFYNVFGEKGKHSRFALSVGALPMGVPVEIAVVAEVE